MSHLEKRPVTIEDLLRLKSTERPPAEFWDKFDRELRAKQRGNPGSPRSSPKPRRWMLA